MSEYPLSNNNETRTMSFFLNTDSIRIIISVELRNLFEVRLIYLLLFHLEIINVLIHPQYKYNRTIGRHCFHIEGEILKRFWLCIFRPRNNAAMKKGEILEKWCSYFGAQIKYSPLDHLSSSIYEWKMHVRIDQHRMDFDISWEGYQQYDGFRHPTCQHVFESFRNELHHCHRQLCKWNITNIINILSNRKC